MPTFAVKNHGLCEVEGLGGLWRQGGTILSNVPRILAVFEEEERAKEGGGRARKRERKTEVQRREHQDVQNVRISHALLPFLKIWRPYLLNMCKNHCKNHETRGGKSGKNA